MHKQETECQKIWVVQGGPDKTMNLQNLTFVSRRFRQRRMERMSAQSDHDGGRLHQNYCDGVVPSDGGTNDN